MVAEGCPRIEYREKVTALDRVVLADISNAIEERLPRWLRFFNKWYPHTELQPAADVVVVNRVLWVLHVGQAVPNSGYLRPGKGLRWLPWR
jgi:hypothetical protein